MVKKAKNAWRVGEARKSHMSGQLMFPIEGPGVVIDYEDWGLTEESAAIAVGALNAANKKPARTVTPGKVKYTLERGKG